jgi:hypothetical protein
VRMRSQISSKTRLGLIGPKSGVLAFIIPGPWLDIVVNVAKRQI